MSNTIQLSEPGVSGLIGTWTGLELWHASTVTGPYTLLTTIPYVALQTTYTYIDTAGLYSDWYQTRRYGPGPTYGPYSVAWSLSSGQVALADIERAAARRMGPVKLGLGTGEVALVGAVGSVTIAAFQSSVDPGGLEDLYVLRRAATAADRQRLVDTIDAPTGRVTVDRNWAAPPAVGELVEFLHIDPAGELRPAVLAGLRRCYFEDRVTVTLSGASAERSLSSVVPWITKRSQIRRVQFAMTGSTSIPGDQTWWTAIEKGGGVWLAGWRDAYPNSLEVTALRPHWSWVNGADSTTGPTLDTDLLDVDIDYAAAAAHIEAWRLFPSRMRTAAEAGYQASQPEAAAEFTVQASGHVSRPQRRWALSAPYSAQSLSEATL